MSTLSWCEATDEEGAAAHVPNCDQHQCFVVKGKKQQVNTGGKEKMPNHYHCTFTCTFCGRAKHYDDECYHKQRMSATFKSEVPQGDNGGGGKSKSKGTGKSKGNGKGQSTGLGGRGGPRNNTKKPGGNTNPTPGGTPTGNPNPTAGRIPTGILARRVQNLRQGATPKLSKSKRRNVLPKTVVKPHLARSENGCGWFINSAKYRVR